MLQIEHPVALCIHAIFSLCPRLPVNSLTFSGHERTHFYLIDHRKTTNFRRTTFEKVGTVVSTHALGIIKYYYLNAA